MIIIVILGDKSYGKNYWILFSHFIEEKTSTLGSGMCVCMLNNGRLFWDRHGPWPTRLLHLWDFPGKNTGVGCHFLLQGIFLTQGSNHVSCISVMGRWILYQ